MNLFNPKKMSREGTIRKFRIVEKEGSREINRKRKPQTFSLKAVKRRISTRINYQMKLEFFDIEERRHF